MGAQSQENTEGEASPAKGCRIDETGRRSDTENACTRASAEKDAEHRSGSESPDG